MTTAQCSETTSPLNYSGVTVESLARFPEENINPVLRIFRDGKIIYANPAGRPLLDVWRCAVGTELAGPLQTQVAAAFSGKTNIMAEAGCGERCYSFSIVNPTGADYVNCYGTDVTNRKRAEAALRENEEKYRLLFAANPSPMFVFDEDTLRFLAVNDAAVRQYGWSHDEFLSLTILDIRPVEEREKAREIILYNIGCRETAIGVLKHYRKDGSIRDMEVSASAITFAGRPGRLCLMNDITERKRAEEAARDAHGRIASVLENIADTFYSLDRTWRFTVVNPAAENAPFGRPSGELLGKVIWELYPGLVGTPIHRRYLDAAENSRLEHYEAQSPLNRRWYEVFMQGHSGGVDVYMRDITGRKDSEAAVKESETKYRRIIETANEGIIFGGTDGRITLVNRKMADMLGYPMEEIVGKNGLEFMAEDQREKVFNNRKKLDRCDPVQDEFCFLRNDGSLLWTIGNSMPIFDDQGGHTGNFAMHTDITELKRRERELNRLNRTLAALGKSSQAMVRARNENDYLQEVCRIIVDDCGHALVWIGFAENDENRSVRPVASAGFEAGYLETLNISWADTERGLGPTGTAIRTGRPAMCRNMLTDPEFAPWRDQAVKRGYAASIVLPLMDGKSAFGALSIYSRHADPFSGDEMNLLSELASDLAHGIIALRLSAAQQKVEEQLAAHMRELAAANKELESFAYSVSHDLRAPLRAIYSFSGLLEDEYADKLEATGRDYLERIGAGARKMNTLIDDIMSLSLISSHELRMEDVDLSEMANCILHNLKMSQPQRRAVFVVAPDLRICVDRRLIEIALTNLLQNAWKYTGKKDESRIEFGVEVYNGENVFFVSDNGAGFDMKHAGRLFTAFSRLHREQDFPGTGIGLAIVNRVVVRHGGRVWAEGRPGEGACFRFYLPLRAGCTCAEPREPGET